MGQQQLLLLVLGIVIVGIAILVGINAYSENSIKANWDALLQDGLRIASDSQSWKSKPFLFGGSPDNSKPDSLDFSALNFVQLGYSQSRVGGGSVDAVAGCYSNLNGVYDLIALATGLVIQGTNVSNQNQITLTVNGTLEANVDLQPDASIKGGALVSDGSQTALSAFKGPCT